MTQIDFYIHVENKLQTLCTLAAKALARKVRLMILTPDAQTTERVGPDALDAARRSAFCRIAGAVTDWRAVTPIIVDHVAEPIVHEQVLVNLATQCPPVFSRFERVIEIVTADDADREAARERFRFYRDRGYEIRNHDLSKAG